MKTELTTVKREIEFKLVLTMTERETKALYCVLRNVGGAPTGPRGAIDEILQVLDETDIWPTSGSTGSLHLPHTWEEFLGEGLVPTRDSSSEDGTSMQ